ncbi:MAG: TIGR01777 family protein [Verrucomicrobiales bacterium]|nr:TIGR01777 family protein [Verrucomicrobiales bacterium]
MNQKKEKVVVAGGTGFLGRALISALLRRKYEVVVLTRNPQACPEGARAVFWDAKTVEESWAAEMEGAKAIVNLVGKHVNCRQTEKNREEILTSRVDSVRAIGDALRLVYRVPEVWVQAGSLAIYGDAGDRVCDETGFIPDEYPTDVCVAWEEALGKAIRPEMRWAMLRIGFVLGSDGGALPALANLARFGMGGRIGSGKQWISWVHVDDMVRVFLEAIENPAVYGICNATGLQPVPNAEFMATLRRVLRVPFGIPTPDWLLRVAAPIVNADPELALNGRRGLPCRIHGLGFHFRFHELEDALVDLLRPGVHIASGKPALNPLPR